ncbi:hypothetical protein [Acuticoccus kandeliae]|uniref:hypothetical protein n=1 Tax=Acuticoccus kandeliae TaxID=2073160 RepID=UPI000D3ECA99|nr:hypothetical protein [Acuticoccus kandeliae]
MPALAELLSQDASHAWPLFRARWCSSRFTVWSRFIRKTIVAAFMIAIRGDVAQIVMLGVAATIFPRLIAEVLALAACVRRRFADRKVKRWQIDRIGPAGGLSS